jgi:hypothetical protein
LNAKFHFPAAKVLLLLAVAVSSAAAQQNDQQAGKAPSKPRHVYTNDDFKGAGSESGDGLPQIPGLVKCGTDLKCFLNALDSASPAAVSRSENVEQGTGVLTSHSTWWTTHCATDQCTFSFRFDAFEAKVNEKVVQDSSPTVRSLVEGKIAEMNHDFEPIRGQTGTCTLPVKDLKDLMTSPGWSLMSLGKASNLGKNCTGAAIDALLAPSSNSKK